MKLALALLSGLAAISSLVYINNRSTIEDQDISLQNMPGFIVHKCGDQGNYIQHLGNKDAYKYGNPQQSTVLQTCHDGTNFNIYFTNNDDYIKNDLPDYDSNLVNQDVNYVFIQAPSTQQQNEYYQIYVAPEEQLQVHNERGRQMNPSILGVTSQVMSNKYKQFWRSHISIPLKSLFGEDFQNQSRLTAQANFYRNDLFRGDECNGEQNCNYYSMNPQFPSLTGPLLTDIVFQL